VIDVELAILVKRFVVGLHRGVRRLERKGHAPGGNGQCTTTASSPEIPGPVHAGSLNLPKPALDLGFFVKILYEGKS
jgi:hypothetical protein